MRCIVIPALIGFALFLVLMNVEISSDSNQSNNKNTTSTRISTENSSYSVSIKFEEIEVTARSMHLTEKIAKNSAHLESSSQYLQTIPPSPRASGCGVNTINNNIGDKCDIDCYGGWLESVPGDLAKLQNNCHGYLKVLVRGYSLSGNTLKALHLNGTFQAEYLRFDSITSNLITKIEEGAFDVYSMAPLKTLIIDKLNAPLLNENTFQGLSLQTFNMTNQPKKFVGTRFLQPFADSLKTLMLRQTDTKTIFDPTNWLQGKHFPFLWQLDLSTINFGNTLRGETFQMLDAIREIYLMNCQITNIADGTFDAVAKTLKILDLSNNQLKTLDANFLRHVNGTFRLELQDNKWNCTCENDQLINALKGPEIIYVGEPVCTTPEDWEDKPFKDESIVLECVRETTTHIDITSSESDEKTTTTIASTFSTLLTSSPPQKPSTPSANTTPLSTTTILPTTTNITPNPPHVTTTKLPLYTTSDTPKTSFYPEASTDPSKTTTKLPIPSQPSTTLLPLDTSSDNINSTFHSTTDPTTTTLNPNHSLSLHCSSLSAYSSEEDNDIILRNYDAYFSIQSQTQHSVTLFIRSNMNDLDLIYFRPRNSTFVNVTNDELTSPYAGRITEINVIGLLSQQLYVFCLIPKNEQKISPFNCLSHFLENTHAQKSDWLSKDNLPWIITVLIIVSILIICCGLGAVYFILRCRPTWLCGSKRIIRKGNKSHEVYLIPKRRAQKENAERNDAHWNLDFESYDYMRSYKHLMKTQQNQVQIHVSPHEPALSTLSGNQSRTSLLPTTMNTEDIIELTDEDGNDYLGVRYVPSN